MSIKQYFSPELIKIFHSDHNGEIRLERFFNQFQLTVDGLLESGVVMVRVWRDSLARLLPKNFKPKNILMLGVAGGSAVKWLSQKWPKAQITGVEIDPVMIDIGKKYFELDKIPNFKLVNADAIKYIKNSQSRWDLILADCYKGYAVPAAFNDIKFLKKCVSLTDNFLINRLYWSEHIAPTDEFERKIRKHFSISSHRTISNKVFQLRPSTRS